MIDSVSTVIRFAPSGEYVEAQLVSLTPEMVRQGITIGWWQRDDLKARLEPRPIDRHWDWNELSIEWGRRVLKSEKVALITGDGVIQGAMMISRDAVESVVEPGKGCLLVELLFTAPHNRSELRRDGQMYFVGTGSKLLSWGAWFSRACGLEGRLRLDGSPDFVEWYEGRGLQRLGLKPTVFEGVSYTPMELPVGAADRLIDAWELERRT